MNDLPLPSPQEPWDQAAYEAIFLAHYDGVYRAIFRVVGSREEAEDLVQETFLRLHGQRFAAGSDHNVRAWLYKVATNLALNALRGDQRREQRHQRAARQALVDGDPVPDPAEVVVQDDERARVRQVLAGLSPRQAQLLMLRHAGLSYREVAKALDIAPGSVGTLLARAHAAFATAYATNVPVGEKGDNDGM
jgi:RNA polymerase sigma-70 factor (ECF subfamily)